MQIYKTKGRFGVFVKCFETKKQIFLRKQKYEKRKMLQKIRGESGIWETGKCRETRTGEFPRGHSVIEVAQVYRYQYKGKQTTKQDKCIASMPLDKARIWLDFN